MAGTEGMDPEFAQRLQALIDASGGAIWINSGFRTHERQAQLYQDGIRRWGEQLVGQHVAPPGHSNHERGLAADLGGNWDLAHKLAPQFGLGFPMGHEPWHIEPFGLHAHDPQSRTTPPSDAPPASQDDPLKRPDVQMFIFSQLLMGKDPTEVQAYVASMYGTGSKAAAPGGQSAGSGAAVSGHGGGGHQSDPEREKWATDFLTALGKPVTPENVRAIVAWQRAESGGGGGRFNPLNTTQGGFPGETNLNSVGVKNYVSYEDGIAANVKVINNGRYGPILAALDRGDNAMSVAHAIGQTPWGTGHLVERILGD